jgi:nanoRNase/pAp phosphatase (c-di-AMP/oligoRNAs hydrolase)
MSQASSPANKTQYVNGLPSPTTPSIEDEDAVSDKSYAESIVESIEEAENAAFVLHDNPDPDAIASGYAGHQLAEKHDTEASIFYGGEIGFEENQEFADMLDAPFTSYSESDESIADFDQVYLLDNNNGGHLDMINQEISEEMPGMDEDIHDYVTSIIDHHTDNTDKCEYPRLHEENKWVETDAGSTATLMAEILDYDDFFTSEVEDDVKECAAAALMRGIETDIYDLDVDASHRLLDEAYRRVEQNGIYEELRSLKEDRLQDIDYSSEYEVRIHDPETPIDNLKFFEVDSEEESDVWRAADDKIIEAPYRTVVVVGSEMDDGVKLSGRARVGEDVDFDIEKFFAEKSDYMKTLKDEEKAWGGKEGRTIHSVGGFLKDETADKFTREIAQMAENYNTGGIKNAGYRRIARDSRKNAKTISRRRARRMPSRRAFSSRRKSIHSGQKSVIPALTVKSR